MRLSSTQTIQYIALAAVISSVMYLMVGTSVVFIVPLLIFAHRFSTTKEALIPVGIVAFVLLFYQIVIGSRGLNIDATYILTLLIGLYMPIMMLIGAALWIALPHKRVVKLLVIMGIAALGGLVIIVWFSSGNQSATSVEQVYRTYVESVAPQLLGASGVNTAGIFDYVVLTLRLMFLPLFMAQFGLSVLISDLIVYRHDETYQERLVNFALPESFVWPFLGLWALVLFSLVLPHLLLQTIAVNGALVLSMLYIIQGMAIASYWLRKRNPAVKASRIYVLASLIVLLPPVNVITLVILPLVGVSETWIKYRKN
ncbi:MAG: hypothetical protein ACOX0W_06170 [Sphaerochaetaceae bacterium]|jgi:hypothetical protein